MFELVRIGALPLVTLVIFSIFRKLCEIVVSLCFGSFQESYA